MTASTLAGVLRGASTRIELSAAGDVRAIRHSDATLVSQYLATPHDAMVGGVFLRRLTPAGTVESAALVGGRADGTFTVDDRCARWSGRALGAQYTVTLTLDPDGVLWVWRVDLSAAPAEADPAADEGATYDVVLAQDLALAPEAMSTSNEPYVSQYVVHHVIDDQRAGAVVASRQTMATAPVLPLALTAVVEGARAYLTDGFSFYGLGAKLDGHAAALDDASWESLTYQYEFAMPTLLGPSFDLTTPRTVHAVTAFVPDYRGELTDAPAAVPDLLDRAVALAATTAPATSAGAGRHTADTDEPAAPGVRAPSVRSLLVSARLLAGRDLTADELVGLTATAAGAANVLRPETAPDGTLLSYFTADATHVVSRAKELLVERPHGHVLKAGSDVTPNVNVFSATTYAYGVFASHV
ncbi:MAG TPA: hypothetical protein VFC06_00865, partial [Demequina sp.]|nr:hypothetical protein [Demequina sp.]